MRLGIHGTGGRAMVVVAAALMGVALAAPAGASGRQVTTRAGFSIDPGPRALAVTFVATSSGFATPPGTFRWRFGDGSSVTTKAPTVTHTYRKPSRFTVTLTEIDSQEQRATAVGTVQLVTCSSASGSCTLQLKHAGVVALLQLHGSRRPGVVATANLMAAPFRIAACESSIAPAVAFTDAGFSGTLTATLTYTTTNPDKVAATCFSSPVAFVDAAGRRVHSGDLRTCGPPTAAPRPPCVSSIHRRGTTVTKIILVPPGDPKVGAP